MSDNAQTALLAAAEVHNRVVKQAKSQYGYAELVESSPAQVLKTADAFYKWLNEKDKQERAF